MLDKYIIGNTNRISPEGPIPVLDITKEVKDDVQMYTVMGGIYVKKGMLDESYDAYQPESNRGLYSLDV